MKSIANNESFCSWSGCTLLRMTVLLASASVGMCQTSVRGLQVLTAQIDPLDRSLLHVSISNMSNRTVAAFAVATPEGPHIEEFFPPNIPGIDPGKTFDFHLGALDAASAQADTNIGFYAIKAVLYADGTKEGNEEELKSIGAIRSGREDAINRLIPLMDKLSRVSDNQFRDAAQRCVEEVQSLDVIPPQGIELAGLYANGVRDAKLRVASSIRQVVAEASSGRDLTRARQLLSRFSQRHAMMSNSLRESRLGK